MKKIDEKTLDEIKRRLVEAYRPLSVYVFGSYAWGTPSDDSDLDIMVIVESSNEKFYKRPRKAFDALWGIHYPTDVLVYTSKEFQERASHVSTLCYKIKKEGLKLYEYSERMVIKSAT